MRHTKVRGWRALGITALALVAAMAAHAGEPSAAARAPGAIVIVPLEPPPLTFGPGINPELALAANTGAALSWTSSEAVAEAGRTLFAISGIVILANLPEQTRRANQRAESAEAVLNADDVWVPTLALAEVARALLTEAGAGEIRISTELRTVPGIENRERTITMHNWYRPIGDWYGMARTPFSYVEPEVLPGERVLEIGLANYELGPGRVLYLLVSAKLVDPVSGKVLRKARKFVYPEVADPRTLFAGDASAFKHAFAAAGRSALKDALRSLGLLAK